MQFSETTATKKIMAMTKRIRATSGGTAASKTISWLLYLIARAQADKTPTLTSAVSESFPHLKRGMIRDFKNIMEGHGYWDDKRWNKTDFIYRYETGSEIEFFSVDAPGKVRGPRRDRLFINEANNVPYETFDQLEIRTKEFIALDWNPVSTFWFYNEVMQRDDVEHITLTYKDNEALAIEVVKSIEQRKGNANWWKVYGLGQLGELSGQIFKDWKIIDSVPHEARLIGYGLDFGYTNHPTAIVAIFWYNGGYILHEITYQRGLSNEQIADVLKNHTPAIVVADSSEPKSIAELQAKEIHMIGAEKGPGSVNQGIQLVQDQRISVTKSSLNIIKEYRGYMWATDKLGKQLNEPEKVNDDTMDAIRYGIQFHNPEAASDKPYLIGVANQHRRATVNQAK